MQFVTESDIEVIEVRNGYQGNFGPIIIVLVSYRIRKKHGKTEMVISVSSAHFMVNLKRISKGWKDVYMLAMK